MKKQLTKLTHGGLKYLLTLLAVFCVSGVRAVDSTPTYTMPKGTFDLKGDACTTTELDKINWTDNKNTLVKKYYMDDDYFAIPALVIGRSSSLVNWISGDNTGNAEKVANTVWTSNSPMQGLNYYLGENATSGYVIKLTTNRMIAVKVTNCTGAKIFSAKNVTINAYDVTSATTETAYNTFTVAKTATTTTGGVTSIEGLDASKTYVIQFVGSTTSNALSYEIALQRASSKTASDLAVSAETASVDINKTADVTYTTSSSGAVSVKSSDEAVATATVANGTVTITGVGEGSATITLSQTADDTYQAGSKTISVTVKDPSILINYNQNTAVTDGITLSSTQDSGGNDFTTVGYANIKTNTTKAYGLKFGKTYTATTDYAKLSVDGGFKEGDKVTVAGFFNNSDNTRLAKVDFFTIGDENAITKLWTSEQFINGRLVNDDPNAQSFTVTDDVTNLYIGRNGGTAVYLTTVKVVRPETVTKYTITCNEAEGGSVTASKTSAVEGATITLTPAPATGYEFESLSVKAADESEVAVTDNKFTMPSQNVTVTATFKEKAKTYTVSIADGIANGTIDATPKADVAAGTEVTVTAKPNFGYALDAISVKAADESEVAVTDNKFTMPAQDVTVSATFKAAEVKYTTSLNAEQIVLDNGKSYTGMATDLANANISCTSYTLDGLDNTKNYRNEPYLGIKIKSSGAQIILTVEANKAIKVKFGEVKKTVNVSGVKLSDGDATTVAASDVDQVYSCTPTEAGYLTFTTTDENAVVLKQVAIGDDEIATATLPALTETRSTAANSYGTICLPYDATAKNAVVMACAGRNTNGLVFNYVGDTEEESVNLKAGVPYLYRATGAEQTFTYGTEVASYKAATADAYNFVGTYTEVANLTEGYYFLYTEDNMFHPAGKINGASETYVNIDAYKCYFTALPEITAAKGAVTFGIFSADPTAINAVNDSANATVADGKFIQNGKLVIVKNGKQYNAAGAQVK